MTLSDEIIRSFKGFSTFTFRDVCAVLSNTHKHISDKTIQVTLSRMVRDERIYSVIKGVFSLQKHDELSGFAFAPFYYGGVAALMIRDLIDDQVKMEVMTTRRVKKSFVEIYKGESRVILHHIPKKYYFGFEDFKYGNLIVPVSKPEKTLIDLFYYKRRLSMQDYSNLLKSIDLVLLNKYLRKYDGRTRKIVQRFVASQRLLAIAGKFENQY